MNLSASANIEKLDGRNYDTWKLHMLSVLGDNDLWRYVKGQIEQPTQKDKKVEWEIKDAKALALIFLGVKENQLSYIKKATSSAIAWKTLESVYSSKNTTRKVMLYRKLFMTRKGQHQFMSEYIREFQNKVDELEEAGIVIPKELVSMMELRDDIPDVETLKVKFLENEMRRQGN